MRTVFIGAAIGAILFTAGIDWHHWQFWAVATLSAVNGVRWSR